MYTLPDSDPHSQGFGHVQRQSPQRRVRPLRRGDQSGHDQLGLRVGRRVDGLAAGAGDAQPEPVGHRAGARVEAVFNATTGSADVKQMTYFFRKQKTEQYFTHLTTLRRLGTVIAWQVFLPTDRVGEQNFNFAIPRRYNLWKRNEI